MSIPRILAPPFFIFFILLAFSILKESVYFSISHLLKMKYTCEKKLIFVISFDQKGELNG
jgi:hypothetical protein